MLTTKITFSSCTLPEKNGNTCLDTRYEWPLGLNQAKLGQSVLLLYFLQEGGLGFNNLTNLRTLTGRMAGNPECTKTRSGPKFTLNDRPKQRPASTAK